MLRIYIINSITYDDHSPLDTRVYSLQGLGHILSATEGRPIT